jgi:hypothetical protein
MTRRTLSILSLMLSFFFVLHLGTPASGEQPAPVTADGRQITFAPALTGPGRAYSEHLPVYEARLWGYEPVVMPSSEGEASAHAAVHGMPHSGSDPANPFAVIRHTAVNYAAPGGTVRYTISLANYDTVTHTYRLTNTLPLPLAYISQAGEDLTYEPESRTLTWQGEVAPGHLEYVIEPAAAPWPYLDLAAFGAPNLCDAFLESGEACADVTVTFNLGVNGYTAVLYDQLLSQVTVSTNGLLLGGDTAGAGPNRWLPDAEAPNNVLAGLWRPVNMGGEENAGGRWHAAVVGGLVEGHDVFYAQWHNAAHSINPNVTARHAIALVLNGTGAFSGHAFFIYDNISDPGQLVEQGYTIGAGDRSGRRGATYAYAPCCGDERSPQGYPPAAGVTLHLRPVLLGADNAYRRTFSYVAAVNAQVPETIANTAVATIAAGDVEPALVWATHYLYVRWQTYLPLLGFDEVAP